MFNTHTHTHTQTHTHTHTHIHIHIHTYSFINSYQYVVKHYSFSCQEIYRGKIWQSIVKNLFTFYLFNSEQWFEYHC